MLHVLSCVSSACSMVLRLQGAVHWLSLAVSDTGLMSVPQPSRAVVGTMGEAVQKRILVSKILTSVSSAAPLDPLQAIAC